MKIKGGHKLDTVIFVVGIVLTDVVIYLLLELLLQGHTNGYSPSSGSKDREEVGGVVKMINSGIYIWQALNLITILVLLYRMLVARSKGSIGARKVSR